jgi:hypothetical protein
MAEQDDILERDLSRPRYAQAVAADTDFGNDVDEAARGASEAGRSAPRPPEGDDKPVKPHRKPRVWWVAAVWAVWAALAVLDPIVLHFGFGSSPAAAGKTLGTPTVSASSPAGGPSSGPTPVRTPSVTASMDPSDAAQALVPVSAEAFGPAGAASGDNPQLAGKAIDASMLTRWLSDWYRTANFGNVQAGTGLLIDMGQRVTVSSVELDLGSASGADVDLLTGDTPEKAQMTLKTTANNASRTLNLGLARPESVRYLLIWFTLLPQDSSGTYQASVYNVAVNGTP